MRNDFTPYGELTLTQREALRDLKTRRHGAAYPRGRGRFSGGDGIYSTHTLDKLVTAGWCRWVHHPGLMPHVELVRDVPNTTRLKKED